MLKRTFLLAIGLATVLLFYGLSSAKDEQAGTPSEIRETLCDVCLKVVGSFQDIIAANKSFEDFHEFFVLACTGALELTRERGYIMCPGLVQSYGPVIQFVLSQKLLDPRTICSDLHFCDVSLASSSSSSSSSSTYLTREQRDRMFLLRWRNFIHDVLVNLPIHHDDMPVLKEGFFKNAGKAHPSLNSSGAAKPAKKSKPSSGAGVLKDSDSIKILQFSDVHLDHFYAPGSPTDCGLYICCRTQWSGKGSAGPYGAYSCDLPNTTLDSLLSHLRDFAPSPDLTLYTGDNPPHDIWMETFSGQVQSTQFLVQYIRNGLGNRTIYPAIGNHESYPQSQYYAPKWEYSNLTRSLSHIWQSWVQLGEEQLRTVEQGGYYTLPLPQYPGLRLMALNTDYGYSANFYTFLNDGNWFYNEHQRWALDTLESAKQKGEKVLIVGHVPPCDTSSTSEFGRFILNISRSYRDTIVGMLMAHTHQDQFNVVKDEEGVYGTVLIAPSVTPFTDQNPSFRVLEMEPKTYKLLDYHQYHLNLTQANELHAEGVEPEWELVYSARETYGLEDLTPSSWYDLLQRMKKDDSLLDTYNYNRHSRSKPKYASCDELCRHTALCEIENVVSSKMYECLVL